MFTEILVGPDPDFLTKSRLNPKNPDPDPQLCFFAPAHLLSTFFSFCLSFSPTLCSKVLFVLSFCRSCLFLSIRTSEQKPNSIHVFFQSYSFLSAIYKNKCTPEKDLGYPFRFILVMFVVVVFFFNFCSICCQKSILFFHPYFILLTVK